MPKNLVIVESPAKAKTIQNYLGKDFEVMSSLGHVRDLPAKRMAVDIKHDFKPEYEISNEKKKVVAALKQAVKGNKTVWLASDEDREGEAIAWHLSEVLKLKADNTRRIVFHEITKPAILAALETPRRIDKNLVDAQQARRVLDRLVGYELSPLLWRKVRPGLSAGRVQSVAVRLIVEREREIAGHEATTTFKISAVLKREPDELAAVYAQQPADKAKAKAVLEQLKTGPFDVLAVDQTEGTRNPAPPFTTSSLQQEASRKLGYSVKRTMNLAQRLYEAGHITYMRTDSVSLSGQSTAMAKDYIGAEFGQNYHQFRRYTTKTRGAQEAHEAIRPTRVERAEAGEDPAQAKLYKLIRGRFLASQMATAKLLKTKIILSNGKAELTAEGEVITFDGWLKAYPQSALKDEVLPKLAVGDKLTLIAAKAEETPGRVPPRYTEANLVRTLEEMGIGRPSTYAPTISTIQDRGYVSREPAPTKEVELTILRLKAGKISQQTEVKTLGGDSKKLLPTDTATVVTDFLLKHFKDVVDYDFTAEVEDEFDAIEVGQRAWNAMIKDFYTDFHKTVMAAAKVTRKEATQARKIGVDPQTKRPILARFGRYGPMLQRGEAEDETKPDFAPLPPGATLENVTLELALKMFELPRDLGEQDGQPIKANIGRYGPYVQLGSTFASIPKDEDVFTIGLSRAQKLIAERQSATKKSLIKDFGDGLIVKSGRFGPYVTNGKTNAKIPKDIDPKKLTLDQVQSLLKKRA